MADVPPGRVARAVLACLLSMALAGCTGSGSGADPSAASSATPITGVMSTTHLEDLLIRNAGRLGVPGVGSVVCSGPLSDGERVRCALITSDVTRQVQVSREPGETGSPGDLIVQLSSGPDVRIKVQGEAH